MTAVYNYKMISRILQFGLKTPPVSIPTKPIRVQNKNQQRTSSLQGRSFLPNPPLECPVSWFPPPLPRPHASMQFPARLAASSGSSLVPTQGGSEAPILASPVCYGGKVVGRLCSHYTRRGLKLSLLLEQGPLWAHYLPLRLMSEWRWWAVGRIRPTATGYEKEMGT